MPTYEYGCPAGHVFEAYGDYDAEVRKCECGRKARRNPCSGVQVINRTGDLGRPVTWAEKRQRENNARVQETVTSNSQTIARETGDKTGFKQHIKR